MSPEPDAERPGTPSDATPPGRLRIDHVTLAGSRLDPLRRAFAALGLETEYGGLHSGGVTHMAVLGFEDGSYVELVSTVEAGARSPIWDRFIWADAGPAAWAVAVEGIAGEAERLRAAGIPVEGPTPWHRDRPDGARAEWELAFPGEGPPGSVLPFLIEDRTPRQLRARPSASAAGSELAGVAAAVIGVARLEEGVELFRRAYGWEPTREDRSPALGARLVGFPGQPAVLAAPVEEEGWLADRLARLGPAPCAFLLWTRDPAASERRFGTLSGAAEAWPGGEVRWLDPDRLRGARIGLLAA